VAGQAIAVARRGDEWIMARHNFIGFQMVRILVTGGASYVGSHACKALAAAGYEPVPATDDARRAGDPARLVADIAHARKNLAWQPVHSSLDNIVSTAWNWHRSSVSADRA